MKFYKFLSLFLPAVIGVNIMNIGASAETAESSLTDSGLNYTETTETINNPGAGYTSTLWYTCKPGDTQVKNPTGNLVLMFIDIGAFSSGHNGTKDSSGNYTEGVDYDLDSTFFEALRGTFENCRNNGCTIALRFRYDAEGKTNPEPASFEQVLKHISQIKESRILEDYKDILMYVESGFLGAWGEQHSGKYTSLEYKAQLLDAMLDCVPDPIPVTVRTPNTVAKWLGIPQNELDTFVAQEGSREARVGMYNDGYMGSDSDLGTFADRKTETDWMNHQMLTSYYGGEFSGDLEWAQKYDTYLPENALPEMYKTHLSYINSNIYQLYKDYTFGSAYDTSGADNSAYYGETVFKFVRDHLGYRFVLRDSDLSSKVEQGGELSLSFTVENTGFANPIRSQNAELILEREGNYVTAPADIDTTKWYSAEKSHTKLTFKIPGYLDVGKWNAYIRFSVGDSTLPTEYMRTVRFANEGTWQPALGANLLGSFEVAECADKKQLTDSTFRQVAPVNEAGASDGEMYTINNIPILDGDRSGSSEWTDDLLVMEKGSNKLYINSDEKYLYIMTETDDDSAAPVFNFQIKNADNGEYYWIYYASNGFVYFNHDSYDGCVFKRSGKYSEFKIPFGDVMGLYPDTKLTSLRFFLQDSGNGWALKEDMTINDFTVPSNFNVYTAKKTICTNEGDSLTFNVYTSTENASYRWYKDGTELAHSNSPHFTIESADESNAGSYTVKITSENIEKDVEICRITNVFAKEDYPQVLKGDADSNGIVNISDAVLLQKYLTKQSEAVDICFENSDMNRDEKVNVIDILCLKRILI